MAGSSPADVRRQPNAAGGYAFALGDDARVHRFLVLGSDGGTYYTSERELTKDNAEVVLRADDAGRKAAFAALPAVCRTGTHLFLFARYVEQFRGWGRGLPRAVGGWYLDRPVGDVAYQAVKYRQREGWSHRDLLRLTHPDTDEGARRDLFRWIVADELDADVPPLVSAFVAAQTASVPELMS